MITILVYARILPVMIRIDPAKHLDITSGIIQNKYLAVVALFLAMGWGRIPVMTTLLDLMLAIMLSVFPFYLLFTLLVNDK